MVYNVNYDIFQSVRLEFLIDAAGKVQKSLGCTKAEINHFDTSSENTIEARKSSAHWLEFLFLLFVIYQTFKLVMKIHDEWALMSKIEDEIDDIQVRQGQSALKRFLLRCGIEPQAIEGHSFIVLIFYAIKGSVFFLISQIFKVIRMLENLYHKSFFIILDIVSLVVFYV